MDALLPVAGVAITAAVTWLVSARRFSGKIDSTEARDLWAESASIRSDYRARIEALERENRELRDGRMKDREQIAKLETRISQLEGTSDIPDYLS